MYVNIFVSWTILSYNLDIIMLTLDLVARVRSRGDNGEKYDLGIR